MKALLRPPIFPRPSLSACCKGFTEEVVWLLDKSEPPVDVNLLDEGGRTAVGGPVHADFP